MATILKQKQSHTQERPETEGQTSSFIRSQVLIFSSRKKHGLLYSVGTLAGLFCIPGILSMMGSTEIQLIFQRTIPPPFITLMIAVGMYILNDLVDADVDRVNSKNRPIPSGLVSKKQAWSFIVLTNGAAVGIAIVSLDLASVVLVMPMILLGILYSAPRIALMNRFVLKNMAIGLFYMLCVLLGITSNYGINHVINNPIVSIHAMAMSGIMIFVGSIVNDLGDTKGDRVGGRRTVPIVFGGENTIKLLIILLLCMPAISWMLYGGFIEYRAISMVTPIAVTILATLALFRMNSIRKVFENMELMRTQHKKWFPLYIVLQSGLVVGTFLPL